jgi:AraC-like DNA-binding protein
LSVDTLIEQATVAAIAADPCPISRVARISRLARDNGTLPPRLATLRRDAIREALANRTASVAALAAQFGISRSRVFQLIRPAGQEASS